MVLRKVKYAAVIASVLPLYSYGGITLCPDSAAGIISSFPAVYSGCAWLTDDGSQQRIVYGSMEVDPPTGQKIIINGYLDSFPSTDPPVTSTYPDPILTLSFTNDTSGVVFMGETYNGDCTEVSSSTFELPTDLGTSPDVAIGYFCGVLEYTEGDRLIYKGHWDGSGFDSGSVVYYAPSTSNKPEIAVQGGYVKLDIIKSSFPSVSDCAYESHYGRMTYDEVNDLLYICNSTGWSVK